MSWRQNAEFAARSRRRESRGRVGRPAGGTERQYLDLDAALAEGRRFRREGPAPVTPTKEYEARLEYYRWLRERLDKEIPKEAPFNQRLEVFRLPPPRKSTRR